MASSSKVRSQRGADEQAVVAGKHVRVENVVFIIDWVFPDARPSAYTF